MEQRFLHIGAHKWPVHYFGEGPRLLIALHGFGEDGRIYEHWQQTLGKVFTIAAVDLPYHGLAESWEPGAFRPEHLVDLIQHLLEDRDQLEYSLAGHSFGGRVLIACLDQLPGNPEAIWLLAPDGLATRRIGLWGRLPLWMRQWIGRSFENHKENWIRVAKKLHQIGWLDAFSVRYIRHHLSDAFRRKRLLGSWMAMPYFPVDRNKLLEFAIKSPLPIHLVLGKKDPLIDWPQLADWLKKWPASNLHELDAGHDLINDRVAGRIVIVDSR